MEVVQYIGGITSVRVGDNISTVGGIQYRGGTYCGGITAVHVGIASVLCRLFSTVGDSISTCY